MGLRPHRNGEYLILLGHLCELLMQDSERLPQIAEWHKNRSNSGHLQDLFVLFQHMRAARVILRFTRNIANYAVRLDSFMYGQSRVAIVAQTKERDRTSSARASAFEALNCCYFLDSQWLKLTQVIPMSIGPIDNCCRN